ncbi:Probable L-fucosamine transferase [Flavobacterium indicum GPTSA100-9 = DSM 17447]|uniref:Probable L-fucosamine transferase n=1 Tax=Flavobacterium indicum (strain DSM 17447 / CIP 109464 / GPTSA100-9) TaxID=1094466 RepID=H8XT55_FLAIG|nr:Probable L-fucosamine transferase [Flavobacterium indicum GPTSA100-9 = DSM 17447]
MALAYPKIPKSSNLYTDLMEEFRDQGHEVFIVAPAVNDSEVGLINEEGISVIRVKTLPLLNVNPIKKGIANVLLPYQYKKAIKKYFKSDSLDLIIMPTPPISLVDVASWLKKKYHSKLYLILRDIFPQNAVDLGLLKKGGLFYNFFRKKEQLLYDVADEIGCMSQGNIDYVVRHNPNVKKEKLHLLPNWQKEIPQFDGDKIALRKKYNFDDNFVIIFGGNIGLPQKLENILAVAELHQPDDKVLFFIVGQGTEKTKIESLVREKNLKNVVIKNSLPREDYQNIISVADCGLISLHEDFTIPNIPSKSLSYFNAKIPILAAIDENTDYGIHIQDEVKAGAWAPSNKPNLIKEKIDLLRTNPQLCNEMGENGYRYFVNNVTPKHSYEVIDKRIN